MTEEPEGLPMSEMASIDASIGRTRRWLMFGLASFIVVASIALVAVGSDNGDRAATIDARSRAADQAGGDRLSFERPDGAQVAVADLVGEALVINFFASWCGPCRAEMPDFEQVHQQLGDDVRFIGLAVNDRADDAAALVAETGVSYEWGFDVDAKIFEALEALVMPTTVFVNPSGEIVEVHAGILTADALAARAEALLG